MANLLLKVDIGGTDYRFALQTISVGGYQWIGKINNISNINTNVGQDKSYSASNVNLELDDTDNQFRGFMTADATRFIYGNEARLYKDDGITLIRLFNITSWRFDLNKFFITLSDNFASLLNTPVWDKYITENEFPNAPDTALGNVINYVAGDIAFPANTSDYGDNMLKCLRVDELTATQKYLIGKTSHTIRAWSSVLTDYKVFDPSGVDRSSSCTLVLGSDGYYYINYSVDVEYLKVYFYINDYPTIERSSIDLLTELLGLLENTIDLTKISTYFTDKEFDDVFEQSEWSYIINSQTTGRQLLNEICEAFALDYYVNSDNEIVLTYLDINNLTANKTFQTAEIKSFSQRNIDTTKIINDVIFNRNYDIFENSFLETSNIKNYNSITNWGFIHSKTENYKTFRPPKVYNAEMTAKLSLINKIEPLRAVTIGLDLDKVLSLELLDIISFAYPSAITTAVRIYQVRGISYDYPNNTATLDLYDIEYANSIDTANKFLLNSNDYNNSNIIYDMSVNGFYGIANQGVYHSTAQKKFGLSSHRYNDSAYLASGGTLQKENFDIADTSITSNFTMEDWVRFDALGANEYFYIQYADANNYIRLFKKTGNIFKFSIQIAGVEVLAFSTSSAVTALTWAHILVVRNGSDWGIYFNGSQEAYVSNANSYSVNAGATIGRDGTGINYFTGYMDGLQINHNNKYNLSPNVGLTDSFVLPTVQQGFYKMDY